MLIAAMLIIPGCGGNNGQLDVYPVSGIVTLQGKPIEGATVMFFGQDEHLRAVGVPIPEGTTDASGKFELTTYEAGDGAPAGNYAVSITWMEETGNSDDPELVTRRDRLKNRYASPDSSDLTAMVEADDNELPPFELQ
jgi:hypothetical protein